MVGFTDGLDVVLLNPVGLEAQEYASPDTAKSPIFMLWPEQMAPEIPALTAGKGFTFIITVSLLLHSPVLKVPVR